MNSEIRKTKRVKGLRFSLGQLLGFMLLIALLISNLGIHRTKCAFDFFDPTGQRNQKRAIRF